MSLSFRLAMILGVRKKRRSHDWVAPEIPMDVMMEIFTRLPAKSLMRFKSVSKLWLSLICSPYFSNRFLTVPSQRLYMSLTDLDKYSNSVILSSAPDTSCSSSFVVDHDLTIPRMGGYILQNLCGFMCYIIGGKPQIYNPATRQLVTLPAINSASYPETSNACYYFGHDPVNDQYKVVCAIAVTLSNTKIRTEHWVFVLKSGDSWKKAAPPNLCPHAPVSRGLSISGVIYYLAWIDTYNSVVVSFDVRSEEFKMIQVPRKDGDVLLKGTKKVSVIEYGGKVAVLDQTNLRAEGMMDLWVLEDAEWSNKTLALQPCQLKLVNKIEVNVKGTTQNGKIFLLPEVLSSPFYVICYDLQSNVMRKIAIKGIPDHWLCKDKAERRFALIFMDQSESVTYLET